MSKCLKFCPGIEIYSRFSLKTSVCRHELGWVSKPPPPKQLTIPILVLSRTPMRLLWCRRQHSLTSMCGAQISAMQLDDVEVEVGSCDSRICFCTMINKSKKVMKDAVDPPLCGQVVLHSCGVSECCSREARLQQQQHTDYRLSRCFSL